MAESIGTAVLTLETDSTKLNQGLSQAQKKVRATGKSMQQWGATMSKRLSLPLAAAGAAAVKFASDLGESMNAVDVVFEDASGTIERFGETASRTVGLAQSDFNELATVIGAQLKQSGMTMDEVSNQTVNLTRRAADLASVFNTDVKTATNALGSALRGETEPARRFGINISQAAIESQALADGMIEAGEEMSEAQKVEARLNLIMEQSADVAGDFQNTSDSLANQLRILWAELKNVGAEFGEVLMPAVKGAIGVVSNIVQGFSGLSDTSKTLITVMGVLAAAIPPVTMAIGTMLTLVGAKLTIITGGLLPALGLLATAAVAIVEHWGPISQFFSDLWDSVVDAFRGAINWIQNTAMKVWQGYADFMLGVIDTIVKGAEILKGALGMDVEGIRSLRSEIAAVREGMKDTAGATRSFADDAERAADATGETSDILSEQKDMSGSLTKEARSLNKEIEDLQNAEQGVADNLTNQRVLYTSIDDIIGSSADSMKDIEDSASNIAKTRFGDSLKSGVETLVDGAMGAATARFGGQLQQGPSTLVEGSIAGGDTRSQTPDASNLGKEFAKEVGDVMENALGSVTSGLAGLANSLVDLIMGAELMQQVFETLKNDILRGLKPVINALAQALVELSPVFQLLGQILGDILMPVVDTIASILRALRPVFAAVARLLSAFGNALQAALPRVMAVVSVLVDALAPAIDVAAVALNALTPFVALVSTLFSALAPIIQILMIPIQALGAALVWLHDNVIKPIGNALLSAMETVANAFIDIARGVIKAINKIPGVSISKPKRADFGRIESIGDVASEIEGPDTDAAEGGTGGGAASIEQERPITVNMTVSDNQIAGDGSFRDLAITIRRELEALGAINA